MTHRVPSLRQPSVFTHLTFDQTGRRMIPLFAICLLKKIQNANVYMDLKKLHQAWKQDRLSQNKNYSLNTYFNRADMNFILSSSTSGNCKIESIENL